VAEATRALGNPAAYDDGYGRCCCCYRSANSLRCSGCFGISPGPCHNPARVLATHLLGGSFFPSIWVRPAQQCGSGALVSASPWKNYGKSTDDDVSFVVHVDGVHMACSGL